jgi:hypothetical protein
MAQQESIISVSQDMMTSLKMNQPLNELEVKLANIPYAKLVSALNSDLKKQAFWTNVYITYSQKLIFETGTCEKSCRNKKIITVGNKVFSLNDILYKILLHSKSKATRVKKVFPSKWERELRIGYPDGRVLLAIDSHEQIVNALTYYEPENMDSQLNEVSLIFVNTFVHYDVEKNQVIIPSWLKNFKREFGKKSGMISGLKRANVIPENANDVKVIYSDKIATLKK